MLLTDLGNRREANTGSPTQFDIRPYGVIHRRDTRLAATNQGTGF